MRYPKPSVKAQDFINKYKDKKTALIQVKQIAISSHNEDYWDCVIKLIEEHDY
jgi:hypothetical protein